MKKIFFYSTIALCIAATLGSCKSDKKKYTAEETFIAPATMVYSAQDSSDINVLVKNYVTAFKAKHLEEASNMLYTVKNDSVHPLTAEAKKNYQNAYAQMPIYDCKVEAFLLRSDKNNEVRLAVQVISNGNIDKNIGVTRICLNPVKIGNKWYLTLLDKDAEGVKDVYAE